MDHNIGKTGDAPLKRVGHTQAGVFGSEPQAKAKGTAGTEATPIIFNG